MTKPRHWTRRAALAAAAAASAVAAAGPALAWTGGRSGAPAALRGICAAAAATPGPARIGALWAGSRDLAAVEAALVARLEHAETDAEWRAALLARGRRDVATGDMVEVDGLRLMRTEAEVLAVGYLLSQGAVVWSGGVRSTGAFAVRDVTSCSLFTVAKRRQDSRASSRPDAVALSSPAVLPSNVGTPRWPGIKPKAPPPAPTGRRRGGRRPRHSSRGRSP